MNVLLEGFDGSAEVYKIVNIPQNDRDYYLSFLKALDTFGHYQKNTILTWCIPKYR